MLKYLLRNTGIRSQCTSSHHLTVASKTLVNPVLSSPSVRSENGARAVLGAANFVETDLRSIRRVLDASNRGNILKPAPLSRRVLP